MTRDQLEHAIRATCDVAGDNELWVFGSQAILGQYPHAPASLRVSVEVDVQPKNRPEATDLIDGVLGELSQFHQTHGFYVHGISIESAKLPEGWQDRITPIQDPIGTRNNTGWCIETHDLAASKLVAFREKDREFVRSLLTEKMVVVRTLKQRVNSLDLEPQILERLSLWLKITEEEL